MCQGPDQRRPPARTVAESFLTFPTVMNRRMIFKKLGICALAALMVSLAWVSEVQAQQTVTSSVAIPAQLQASVTTFDCTNSPGPWITFEGGVALAGVNVELVFRNNINTLRFPKQPVLGGVGGNPWISVRFASGSGNPLGEEVLLGRCVQLMPGN